MNNLQAAWTAWLTTSEERVIAHDDGDPNTHFPSAFNVPPKALCMSLLRPNESAFASKL